jgi:predicted glycosyltransferase
MLSICEYLLASIPNVSILLVSGSPMLHSFRIPAGLDYIKLPCINRGYSGNLSTKYLGTQVDETIKLRTDIILAATANFKPDLLLVDKKPYGLNRELKPTIDHIKCFLHHTKLVLLLRDILDCPEVTIKEWQKHEYYTAIQEFYDKVLVVGTSEVFDFCQEYQCPSTITPKIQQCGYIRKNFKDNSNVFHQLALKPQEKLVLVTPGGGEDGYQLVNAYLSGLALLPTTHHIKSVVIVGPEMPQFHRQALYQVAEQYSHVQICEFTERLNIYMKRANVVICMGGYNTLCEVISLNKRAIVVPRIHPVAEQRIRAERMANLGLVRMIHPHNLTAENLMRSLLSELDDTQEYQLPSIDLNALPRISKCIEMLLYNQAADSMQYLTKEIQWLATTILKSGIY